MNNHDFLADWVPLFLQHGQVHWAYMGAERFTGPFCQDNLQRLAARPFNQLFRQRTGLDVLLGRAQTHPGLPLQGLVFHMSRCGSTLLAQALTALPDSVVLSEPPAVDTLLQWLNTAPDYGNAAGDALLRGLVCALGQPRRAQDRRLFVKTDCWHIGHIDRILRAFPNVPWLFLYRDPLEVLVSQAKIPALYLIPGALVNHGLKPPEELLHQPLAHGAWVLSHVLEAAIRAMHQHSGGLLVNYSELPDAIDTRIASHFHLNLTDTDTALLKSVRSQYSKNPQHVFQADTAQKRAQATPDLAAMAARWLDGPYTDLEQLRHAQLGDAGADSID